MMGNGSACKKKWTLPYLNDNYVAVGCLDTKHVKSSGAPEVAAHVDPFCNSESQCAFNTRNKITASLISIYDNNLWTNTELV